MTEDEIGEAAGESVTRGSISEGLPWLAALIMVGLVVYGWISWHASAVMGFTDALDYLLIADYFQGLLHGHAEEFAASYYQSTRFPPLYPLLLGALGAGSKAQSLAILVTNVTTILSAIAVWFWARPGLGVRYATVIAAFLILNPVYFLLNLHSVSEPLSILVLYLALLAGTSPITNGKRLFLTAALVGACPLIRTAMTPLVIAFFVFAAKNRNQFSRSTLLGSCAVSSLPLIGWLTYRHSLGAESYLESFDLEFALAQTGGWPDALWNQPTQLFFALVDSWGSPGSLLPFVATILLAALAASQIPRRLIGLNMDAWFLAGYLCLLLIWPYPDEFQRLWLPAYPILFYYALGTVEKIDSKLSQRLNSTHAARPASIGLVALLVLSLVPTAFHYVGRTMLHIDPELRADQRHPMFFTAETNSDAVRSAEQHLRVRLMATQLPSLLPPDACIYASDPRLLRVQAGVDARSYPVGVESPADAATKLHDCNYYFVSSFGMRALGIPPLYPKQALEGWAQPELISIQETATGPVIAAAVFHHTDD